MSCPVMHESRPAAQGSSGGGCPVMHGPSVVSTEESHQDKVFNACKDHILSYNLCQTKDVATDKSKTNCLEEANALRECELARRRREKQTKRFEDCVKKGGDAVKCLQESRVGE